MVDSLTDDGSYRAQQEHEEHQLAYIVELVCRMMEHNSTDEDAQYVARALLPKATREKYETFRLD